MRKTVGSVVALIGAFLLVAGIMGQFYAPSRLEKTPINVDSTTHVSGKVQLSDGTALQTYPVLAWSITKADSDKSDSDVVVFANSSCLVKDEGGIDGCVSSDDPQDRLLTASTDDFATDRVTALAVNDPKYLPADAVPHEGLINKWPFDPEKKTYPYYDSSVGGAVDAVYDRSEKVNGLDTHVYKVSVRGQPIEIADGVPGLYDDDKELFIDTVTGSIIQQTEHQEQLDVDGKPVLIADLSFTDDQVQTNVDDAKANGSKLNLVRKTLPLVGWLVGIPLLLIGLLVLFLARRGENRRSED